ncbi:tyrosine-protein phosphatase [Dyella silvatica]|uniref:tyrosine-protein phosphatase n=1 Tax=Dyella silvatica TaxID=2992128 RepID=UPI0022545232|nr:tyrosine-protein phosphatase [Dyella silvatica]
MGSTADDLVNAAQAEANDALASAVAAPPRFASVDNFRDIGGPANGYPTVDGRRMRRGVFYRANALTFSAADKAVVDTLGIAVVCDLRTPTEIAHTPDVLPVGAVHMNFNIAGLDAPARPQLSSADEAVAMMETLGRQFVTGAMPCAGFRSLLLQLAALPQVQLFHCTSGKDRTGWATALLQSLAGVPQEIIVQDYLLTKTYAVTSLQARLEGLRKAYGDTVMQIYAPMLEVRASYLLASFDQVRISYGTMDNYLTQGLELQPSTMESLRLRLLV